ncbi:hypothetical protein K3172_04000 [Qipengyuania sp. 6B39]|uniref:hypothetical protein n=1 Tax=Qipengyuania proteolytica TaxID=2867239 RepID=UPI001C8A60DC|nr:hypothetical protein [Qipengyuania proteolytica]MBX7495018.1 hypothetical protein [Qipengyuania proteolytica]
MIRTLVQVAVLIVVFVYAWRRGGWPEKALATGLLSQILLDQTFHAVIGEGGDYLGLHPWHFFLDCLLLALIVTIALKADRFWTLWAGSLQLLAVGGHVLRAIDGGMFPLIYAILERFPFWMLILITGWGTYNHQQRSRPTGSRTSPKG